MTHAARALAHAVDAKAHYVPSHCEGVAYLLGMMAAEQGYDPEQVRRLELAGLLHDVGKLHIPDRILNAERRITSEEFEIIKTHSRWSAHIVRMLEGLEFLTEWVLHHHEHFDGGGYPYGLKGDEIPWASRQILAADAFHVMTSDRPYQSARTRGAAIEILRAEAGKQFDPAAVDLMLSRDVLRRADANPSASGR